MAKKSWKTVSKDKKRVVVQASDGTKKTLLTPTGKNAKFKAELASGVKITNDGKRKKDENGKPMKLSKADKAYRHGYRKALGEVSAIHKKKRSRTRTTTPRSRKGK